MQKKARIWWVLVSCMAAYCVISAWIVVAYPGRVLSLLFYFTYMTLACTVLPLPTHFIVIDYAQRFNDPYLIAVLGGIGTSLSALIDYVLLVFISRYANMERIKATRTYCRVERLFKKAGFATLLVISLLPFPLELAKVLGCVTRYNMIKFLVAIFLGRGIRYFLLGVGVPPISPFYLYGSTFLLLAIEVVRRLLKKRRNSRTKDPTAGNIWRCKDGSGSGRRGHREVRGGASTRGNRPSQGRTLFPSPVWPLR